MTRDTPEGDALSALDDDVEDLEPLEQEGGEREGERRMRRPLRITLVVAGVVLGSLGTALVGFIDPDGFGLVDVVASFVQGDGDGTVGSRPWFWMSVRVIVISTVLVLSKTLLFPILKERGGEAFAKGFSQNWYLILVMYVLFECVIAFSVYTAQP